MTDYESMVDCQKREVDGHKWAGSSMINKNNIEYQIRNQDKSAYIQHEFVPFTLSVRGPWHCSQGVITSWATDPAATLASSPNLGPFAAPPSVPADPERAILALQVQVFLEASEDVDVDAATVQDILAVLVNGDSDGGEDDVDAEEGLGGLHLVSEADSDDIEEFDISAHFPALSERPGFQAKKSWSKQEVKFMMHLLKERGSSAFVEEFVEKRRHPIPDLLQAFDIELCPELQNRRPQTMLYFLRVVLSHQLRNRDKLSQYNSISDAVDLIRKSQRILILTGAGISVSCGIPDFRSRDGLYASLKSKGDYDLDDPQQMFDIQYFKENPSVLLQGELIAIDIEKPLALSSTPYSQIYPSNFVPSPCHRFIKLIEDQGKLLRNYTQNIDTLETLAGVQNVLQCHGSFATATCLQCRKRVQGAEIETEILSRRVPLCKTCNPVPYVPVQRKGKTSKKKAMGQWDSDVEDESDSPEYPPGIMKPDITFFGEKLTDEFDRSLEEDRLKVDLLLVVGTSLKVSPVAEILSHLPHSVPQILINKTPIRHINPDASPKLNPAFNSIVLLGNADDIVLYLCAQLGWKLPPSKELPQPSVNLNNTRLQPPRGNPKKRASTDDSDFRNIADPERVGDSHVWLFDGAEGGKWLHDLEHRLGIQKSATTVTPVPSATNSAQSTRPSTPGSGARCAKDMDAPRESKKARIG